MSRKTHLSQKSRSPQKKISRKRSLRLEALEPRALLNGTSLFSEQSHLWLLNGSSFQAQLASRSLSAANSAPTIATAANASSRTVTSTTVQLSVKGNDNGGEKNLSYIWSVLSQPVGAASPTFSANGNNGAKNTKVTFKAAGTYTFLVTLRDSGNLTTTSQVTVNVSQSLAQITVTPGTASLSFNASQQFTAVGVDQFGKTMSVQPAFRWTATTGTISSSGLFTASVAAGGKSTITATSGSIRGTAAVTVSNSAPTVISATASSSTVTGSTVQLAALGADNAGESNLIYTWAATTLPTGATAPTFSINGSNAAKSTTATFKAAGTYIFTVTIKDAGNLSVTSRVTITVVQAVAKITVTPGTAALSANGTQQFAASALDQFGRAMTATFSWSATSGSITSAGLYTAPSSAGSATITAAVGLVNGTSTVTISGSSTFLNLKDAALAALAQSLFVDQSISRADMIQLLNSTGTDGTVNANEFADLKTIIANATTLKMADYVRVLASDVVNGNAANAYYQGTTLGNLAAGSTSATLTKLVQKWFYGADRPTLNSSSFSYRTASGSLFATTPSHLDEKQGYLGDCYFITALGMLADSNPQAVRNMFVDNGDGTFTVRFYTGTYGYSYNGDGTYSEGFSNGAGTADYVTVDLQLATTSSGMLVYSNYGAMYNNSANTLWICLAEKAYAQWNETGKEGRNGTNTFSGIEGGWMSTVNAQVLGYNSTEYTTSTSTKQLTINAINAHKALSTGTNSNWSGTNCGLYANHAYGIIGYNAQTDTFTLYNPWGSSQPGQLTWSQIMSTCTWMMYADSSGTKTISGSPVVSTSLKSTFSEPFVNYAAATSLWSMDETTLLQNVSAGGDALLSQPVQAALTTRPALDARDSLFASASWQESRLAAGGSSWTSARNRLGESHTIDSSFEAIENLLQEVESEKSEDVFSENYSLLNVETAFLVN